MFQLRQHHTLTFTFMHLADVFIQSDLQVEGLIKHVLILMST